MCNLYSMTTNQEAIRRLFAVDMDLTGNLPPLPNIFPDYAAPVVHARDGERTLSMMRWGMPSSSKSLYDATAKRTDKLRAKSKAVDLDALLRMEPDGGTTNVRNVASKHWRRWLDPESRCLVPFTNFNEFNRDAGGVVWFAFDESRPLACFAGIRSRAGPRRGRPRRARSRLTCSASWRPIRTRWSGRSTRRPCR